MKIHHKAAMVAGALAFIGLRNVSGNVQAAGLEKDKTDQAKIKQTAQTEAKSEILVTFVELGSVNCLPCKAMQPVMKAIEEEYGTQVKVVFYDVWTQAGQPYARHYRIRGIPTQVFLDKDNKEFFRHVGFFSKTEIVKVLQKQGVK